MKCEKEQLHKFINDFADGGAINHLADLGYTVDEIAGKLDYPLPKSVVADKVWQHFLYTGKVLLEEPNQGQSYIEHVTYEKVQGQYGRSYMQQKKTRIPISDKAYIRCDFGIHMKRDNMGFIKRIEALADDDKKYILGLPWPRAVVYHEMDQRMTRINEVLGG